MKTRILIVLIALLPSLAFAQANQTEKDIPYVEVVGSGEMEVIPDQIYISFTLKERIENKVKLAIEAQEAELKKRLVNLKIDLKDLQLADANSDLIKIKRKKNDVIASKDYLLKVSNTSALAKVFELLDDVKVFDAGIERVDHSDIQKMRKDVKILAVKEAKEKAEYMLAAIGETVGKPLIIQEREMFDEFQPLSKVANASMLMNVSEPQNEEIPELSFQKIKLKYTVFARFAIK